MKDESIEQIKKQIDVWGLEIERMQKDIQKVKAEARFAYQKRLAELQNRRELAVDRFEELQEASEESFQSVMDGVMSAWRDLSDGINEARKAFRGHN